MKRLFLFCIVVPIVSIGWCEEAEPLQFQAFRKMMQEAGVPEKDSSSLLTAIEEMEESGDVSGIQPFLDSEHELVSMFAGCVVAVFEPKQTRRWLHRELEKPEAALGKFRLIAGSLVASRKTVDLFLAKWEEDENIEYALSIATGENHTTLEEWQKWWKTERDAFKPQKVPSLDEAFARMQRGGFAKVKNMMKDLGNSLKSEDGDDKPDPLASVFGKLGELQELGEEKENKWAAKGDRQFRSGKLDKAYESYTTAIEEVKSDVKSRYLLGCIDFERGNYELAKQRFEIVGQHGDAFTARFLAKLSNRKLESGEEKLSESVLRVLEGHSAPELDGLRSLDDLVINRIVGQSMAQKGLYHLGMDEIHELIGSHPEDEQIQAGGLMLLPPVARRQMVEAFAENCPDSPLAQYMAICQSLRYFSKKELVKTCAERWLKVEPDNFLPLYFLEHSLHLIEEEPDYENPATFPEEVWRKLISAAKTSKVDSHFPEAIKAQEKAIEQIGYPFLAVKSQSIYPPVLELADAAKKRVESQLATNPDAAQETILVIKRITEVPGTGIWLTMRRALISIAEKPMQKKGQEVGRNEARSFTSAFMTFLSVQQLPIPKLQNELFQAQWTDSQKYLTRIQEALKTDETE